MLILILASITIQNIFNLFNYFLFLCLLTDTEHEDMEYKHTGVNISKGSQYILEKYTLNDFNYRDEKVPFATDLGSSMIASCREAGVPHIPCAAHRIRTVVETAYNASKENSNKFNKMDRSIKKIVRRVKKTNTQTKMNPTLKSYCVTRFCNKLCVFVCIPNFVCVSVRVFVCSHKKFMLTKTQIHSNCSKKYSN